MMCDLLEGEDFAVSSTAFRDTITAGWTEEEEFALTAMC